jgi:hydroxymethylpyrimidine/phosphomethylpyrimidine kinase
MLGNADVIHAVADALEAHRPPAVVLDPVMVASSGARLLAEDALEALRARLLPLATVLTPNIPEAELLLGHAIENDDDADAALVQLLALDPRAVLLKGGHLPGDGPMVDRFDDGDALLEFEHPRLPGSGHGTGCTLASAIAANLCRGLDVREACAAATDYVHGALAHGWRPGRGDVLVLDHFWRRHGA